MCNQTWIFLNILILFHVIWLRSVYKDWECYFSLDNSTVEGLEAGTSIFPIRIAALRAHWPPCFCSRLPSVSNSLSWKPSFFPITLNQSPKTVKFPSKTLLWTATVLVNPNAFIYLFKTLFFSVHGMYQTLWQVSRCSSFIFKKWFLSTICSL